MQKPIRIHDPQASLFFLKPYCEEHIFDHKVQIDVCIFSSTEGGNPRRKSGQRIRDPK